MTEPVAPTSPTPAPGTRPLRGLSKRGGGAFLSVVAAGLFAQAVTVFSAPLVARMLGPEGRGQMVLLIVVATMASLIAAGGLPAAIARAVGGAKGTARDVVGPHVTSWIPRALVCSVGAGIAAGLLLHGAGSTLPLFVAEAVLLTLATITQHLLAGMVQGEGDTRWYNAFRLAGLVTYAVAVVAIFVIFSSSTPTVLLAVFTGCSCVGLLVGLRALRPATGAAPPADRTELRTFARQSFASGVGPLDGLGLDLLLVGAVLGKSELGLYAVAVSTANLTGIVLTGIAQILLPRLVAHTQDAARRMARRWTLAAGAAAVLVAGTLQLLVDPVVRFAFGPEFVDAIGCARVLIVAWVFLGLRRVLTAVAQAQGHARFASTVESVGLGSLVVGILVVGSLAGITEVAVVLGAVACGTCLALAARISWRA